MDDTLHDMIAHAVYAYVRRDVQARDHGARGGFYKFDAHSQYVAPIPEVVARVSGGMHENDSIYMAYDPELAGFIIGYIARLRGIQQRANVAADQVTSRVEHE
jgi:hypothetical protein